MRSTFVVVDLPAFDPAPGVGQGARDMNHAAFRHSRRTRALHASMKALSVGFPGSREVHFDSI